MKFVLVPCPFPSSDRSISAIKQDTDIYHIYLFLFCQQPVPILVIQPDLGTYQTVHIWLNQPVSVVHPIFSESQSIDVLELLGEM